MSISGYNTNPPPDDGTTGANNQLKWSKHKDKIGDPLKNLAESINTNVLSAFGKTINTDPDQNNTIAGSMAFTASELTISGGSVEIKRSHHTIDTELDTATDFLSTIDNSSTSDGAIVYLRSANSAREVTIDSSGNIVAFSDIVLSTTRSTVFQRIGTTWYRINENRITLKHFGAVGDGVTDDSAAQIAAAASGEHFTVTEGTYLGSGIKIITDKQSVTFEGDVTLKALANNDVLFWNAADFCQHSGTFTTDSNSKTGVWGLLCGPADLTQTTLLVSNSHNRLPGIIGDSGLTELTVLQAGPDVGGTDSGCFYNMFPYGRGRGATRNMWLRSPPNAGGAPCNRNSFWDYRAGTQGGSASNTGLQIDAGDTNDFFNCNFEGVASGTSPNATPTAVKILNTDPISSADNNTNRFYGGFCESNTRDVDNANPTTQFFGFGYNDTISVFSAGPSIAIGGRDSSQTRQIMPGAQFTNVAGDSQLDSLKLTTGKLAFLVTQAATADPNTLDDYEEGTWTLTITADTTAGTPTYSVQSGTYRKLGRWVKISGTVTFTGGTLPTGSFVNIAGLPFLSNNGDAAHLTPISLIPSNLTGGTAGRIAMAHIADALTQINLIEVDQDGQPFSSLVMARLTSTTSFEVSGEYRTTN